MPLVMETRPAAYSVIIERANILLCHYRTRTADGQLIEGWTLPGGGIEVDEQPHDTAVREALEETGYRIATENLLGIQAAYFPRADGTVFCALRTLYRSHILSGELHCEQEGSTDRVEWVPLSELDSRLPEARKDTAKSLLDTAASMMGYRDACYWAQRIREEKR